MIPTGVRTWMLSDATITIELSGSIDGDVLEVLHQTLIDVIMKQRPVRVVIDTRNATNVDDMAAGAVMAAIETAQEIGIEMTIAPIGNILTCLDH